jgi:basic amino acid/polyamine antiporter, APA family
MTKNKISLPIAVLICLNTILGGGIFINAQQLAITAGSAGFVGYILGSMVVFPLVLSLAELAKLQPVSGGLFVYVKEYTSDGFGFLSGWSYFIAKTVSAALLIHSFNSYFSKSLGLAYIPILLLDYFVIFFLIFLNVVGVRIGGKAQYLFFLFKITPILFAFIFGTYLFNPDFFALSDVGGSILQTIPVSLYALAGFEIICAVGGLVENPSVNIKRAIIISFFIVFSITTIFQLVVFGALGPHLKIISNLYSTLGRQAMPVFPELGNIVNGIVFASIIGGAMNILSGNCWNLKVLADNNFLPFSSFLSKTNSGSVPWVSLLVEGVIAALIITITKSKIHLQNMSVFALYTTFTLSAVAAFFATRKVVTSIPSWIPLLAVMSGSYVIALCFFNMIKFGVSISFLSIFLVGCISAFLKNRQTHR